MKQTPKWKRFEQLVSQIQKTLSPDCEITTDQKILGKKSGRMRQVDICIKKKVGQFELLVAMECKDLKRPVNVKAVESFMGLAEDIQANQAVLVSSSGFSAAAKKRGADAGLTLYRTVDAEKHDWQTYVALPTICEFVNVRYSVTFKLIGAGGVAGGDWPSMVLYDKHGGSLGSIHENVSRAWNNGDLPIDVGEHNDIPLFAHTVCTRSGNMQSEVNLSVNLLVELTYYKGEVPLVEIKGFEDQITGDIVTKSMTTAILGTHEVAKNWQEISAEQAARERPLLRLGAKQML